MRAPLLLLGAAVGLMLGFGEALPTDRRQTGSAEGFTERIPRAQLCRAAQDSAWARVRGSCGRGREVVRAVADGCTTTDFSPAGSDGRGPWQRVQVQVRYSCR
jgi:hypothetical protein